MKEGIQKSYSGDYNEVVGLYIVCRLTSISQHISSVNEHFYFKHSIDVIRDKKGRRRFQRKLVRDTRGQNERTHVSLTFLPLTQDFKFYKKKNSTAAKRFDYILTASSSRTKT